MRCDGLHVAVSNFTCHIKSRWLCGTDTTLATNRWPANGTNGKRARSRVPPTLTITVYFVVLANCEVKEDILPTNRTTFSVYSKGWMSAQLRAGNAEFVCEVNEYCVARTFYAISNPDNFPLSVFPPFDTRTMEPHGLMRLWRNLSPCFFTGWLPNSGYPMEFGEVFSLPSASLILTQPAAIHFTYFSGFIDITVAPLRSIFGYQELTLGLLGVETNTAHLVRLASSDLSSKRSNILVSWARMQTNLTLSRGNHRDVLTFILTFCLVQTQAWLRP